MLLSAVMERAADVRLARLCGNVMGGITPVVKTCSSMPGSVAWTHPAMIFAAGQFCMCRVFLRHRPQQDRH